MGKRMFSTSGASIRQAGGDCSKCDAQVGVTLFYDIHTRYCKDCANNSTKATPECYMIRNKGCLKVLANTKDQFTKKPSIKLDNSDNPDSTKIMSYGKKSKKFYYKIEQAHNLDGNTLGYKVYIIN